MASPSAMMLVARFVKMTGWLGLSTLSELSNPEALNSFACSM